MQLSILGCGWLGLPLAEAMIQKGFEVKGSTTSPDKLALLQSAHINAYAINLSATGIKGEIAAFLEGSEILVIDIPPKAKEGNFPDKIRMLLPYIEKAGIAKIIFVSSISVYSDETPLVTEQTIPMPVTESGKQLLEAEQVLGDKFPQTTVIRFGGLIGGERHPVKHLAGKTGRENPDAPVNLIHRDDCIGIILRIIERDAWGEVFNGVAPSHPTRKEYYTFKAEAYGLPLPMFSTDSTFNGKIISADKIMEKLDYSFREI